jgi:hypothetical protein
MLSTGTRIKGTTKLTSPRSLPQMMYLLVSGVVSMMSSESDSLSLVSDEAAVLVAMTRMTPNSIAMIPASHMRVTAAVKPAALVW